MAGVLVAGEVQAQDCEIRRALLDPVSGRLDLNFNFTDLGVIDLNVVAVDKFFKTIEVEKFVFDCDFTFTGQINAPQRTREVQIFTEIVEGFSHGGVVAISKRFEVITCDKVLANTSVSCSTSTPPNLRGPVSVFGCFRWPSRIKMQTAVLGNLAKTVKAQKELFCSGPLVAVTTFTEIVERATQQGLAVVQKGVELSVCDIDVSEGTVRGCGMFSVPLESR
jgi:hypothetical protein